jgi:hypothetical protein
VCWKRRGKPERICLSLALLNSLGLSWALAGPSELTWALLGASGQSSALLGSPELSWALLGTLELSWTLHGSPAPPPGYSWVLLGSPALVSSFGLCWPLLSSIGLSLTYPWLSWALLRALGLSISKHIYIYIYIYNYLFIYLGHKHHGPMLPYNNEIQAFASQNQSFLRKYKFLLYRTNYS